MFLHEKDHAKDLALFEIKLKTHGLKNTVLVKGNEAEVENIPLHGCVKLLTKLDLHVKRIRLVLTGDQDVEYESRLFDGFAGVPISERNCVMRVVWPNLLCLPNGELHFGNYADLVAKYHYVDLLARKSHDNSFTDLASLHTDTHTPPGGKRPAFHKTKSQPLLFKNPESSLVRVPRAGIDGTPCPAYAGAWGRGHSFLLPNGNYTLPFSFFLPANTPESVESLAAGKIRYKLECVVERGRFDRPFKKATHVRIVRTLHPRNVNRYDSIDYANTWPGKIDFKVSAPHKGIALGSLVPIKLIIVPLTKGLSFKSMYAEIVQTSYVSGISGRSPLAEEVLARRKVLCPNPDIGQDHWQVQGMYQLPCSLSEITQTCSIKSSLVSVRHRLRVGIHMRNLDGHVSELRAFLPVVIYMSPTHGHVTARHMDVDSNGHFVPAPDDSAEDVLFPARDPVNSRSESLEGASAEGYEEDEDEDPAPPVYNSHKKDTVFDYNSPLSPIEQLRANSVGAAPMGGYFDFVPPKADASAKILDLATLLKIPCYEEAIEDDVDEYSEGPAPYYAADSAFAPPASPPCSMPRPLMQPRSSSMSNLTAQGKSSPAKKKHLFLRREKK
ncbi:hypothetical protein METBIDRAFT_11247 [Metschnikowia bicuspidata var. bicuspidata NRRL YB-4993]|uniref:Arrestin C-terminal-like domain-containing protein n=1 Tax=Metschnikowia bicuspidata var. bicuspidata NRRL YB-4993 TaxID=869754 RepID=A0A1A0HE72_9ASCO|nr:hypothetical protein METBIDRAFT_11247 [Metschnikowia bicuspidata var. bicuspidata NRRL YB-4993]OBA22409.1 hypothetical protein METBIDRAFT_11247 [Metschnikowia bicuspidata var. bicuspidata NRRL YB-4993]